MNAEPPDHDHGAVVLTCRDLAANQAFFAALGFRLLVIFPADDPRVASLSGFGLCVRLERGERDGGGHLRLPGAPARTCVAPNGARIDIVPGETAATADAPATFVVSRQADAAKWLEGRAGMLYRDLIPGRQGGALVASHIRIPRGGPVPDYVHFHKVSAQVIYCKAGWVRVVYEDQGEPFVMRAGDCVLQPPEIRHRVLECSDGLEVIEVSAPAEHVTCVEHAMTLPTTVRRPDRMFAGQRFVWHRAEHATWNAWDLAGWLARDTGIGAATEGAIDVRVMRAQTPSARTFVHGDARRFWCVLHGEVEVEQGTEAHVLQSGGACMLPPHAAISLRAAADAEFLEVRFVIATLARQS